MRCWRMSNTHQHDKSTLYYITASAMDVGPIEGRTTDF